MPAWAPRNYPENKTDKRLVDRTSHISSNKLANPSKCRPSSSSKIGNNTETQAATTSKTVNNNNPVAGRVLTKTESNGESSQSITCLKNGNNKAPTKTDQTVKPSTPERGRTVQTVTSRKAGNRMGKVVAPTKRERNKSGTSVRTKSNKTGQTVSSERPVGNKTSRPLTSTTLERNKTRQSVTFANINSNKPSQTLAVSKIEGNKTAQPVNSVRSDKNQTGQGVSSSKGENNKTTQSVNTTKTETIKSGQTEAVSKTENNKTVQFVTFTKPDEIKTGQTAAFSKFESNITAPTVNSTKIDKNKIGQNTSFSKNENNRTVQFVTSTKCENHRTGQTTIPSRSESNKTGQSVPSTKVENKNDDQSVSFSKYEINKSCQTITPPNVDRFRTGQVPDSARIENNKKRKDTSSRSYKTEQTICVKKSVCEPHEKEANSNKDDQSKDNDSNSLSWKDYLLQKLDILDFQKESLAKEEKGLADAGVQVSLRDIRQDPKLNRRKSPTLQTVEQNNRPPTFQLKPVDQNVYVFTVPQGPRDRSPSKQIKDSVFIKEENKTGSVKSLSSTDSEQIERVLNYQDLVKEYNEITSSSLKLGFVSSEKNQVRKEQTVSTSKNDKLEVEGKRKDIKRQSPPRKHMKQDPFSAATSTRNLARQRLAARKSKSLKPFSPNTQKEFNEATKTKRDSKVSKAVKSGTSNLHYHQTISRVKQPYMTKPKRNPLRDKLSDGSDSDKDHKQNVKEKVLKELAELEERLAELSKGKIDEYASNVFSILDTMNSSNETAESKLQGKGIKTNQVQTGENKGKNVCAETTRTKHHSRGCNSVSHYTQEINQHRATSHSPISDTKDSKVLTSPSPNNQDKEQRSFSTPCREPTENQTKEKEKPILDSLSLTRRAQDTKQYQPRSDSATHPTVDTKQQRPWTSNCLERHVEDTNKSTQDSKQRPRSASPEHTKPQSLDNSSPESDTDDVASNKMKRKIYRKRRISPSGKTQGKSRHRNDSTLDKEYQKLDPDAPVLQTKTISDKRTATLYPENTAQDKGSKICLISSSEDDIIKAMDIGKQQTQSDGSVENFFSALEISVSMAQFANYLRNSVAYMFGGNEKETIPDEKGTANIMTNVVSATPCLMEESLKPVQSEALVNAHKTDTSPTNKKERHKSHKDKKRKENTSERKYKTQHSTEEKKYEKVLNNSNTCVEQLNAYATEPVTDIFEKSKRRISATRKEDARNKTNSLSGLSDKTIKQIISGFSFDNKTDSCTTYSNATTIGSPYEEPKEICGRRTETQAATLLDSLGAENVFQYSKTPRTKEILKFLESEAGIYSVDEELLNQIEEERRKRSRKTKINPEMRPNVTIMCLLPTKRRIPVIKASSQVKSQALDKDTSTAPYNNMRKTPSDINDKSRKSFIIVDNDIDKDILQYFGSDSGGFIAKNFNPLGKDENGEAKEIRKLSTNEMVKPPVNVRVQYIPVIQNWSSEFPSLPLKETEFNEATNCSGDKYETLLHKGMESLEDLTTSSLLETRRVASLKSRSLFEELESSYINKSGVDKRIWDKIMQLDYKNELTTDEETETIDSRSDVSTEDDFGVMLSYGYSQAKAIHEVLVNSENAMQQEIASAIANKIENKLEPSVSQEVNKIIVKAATKAENQIRARVRSVARHLKYILSIESVDECKDNESQVTNVQNDHVRENEEKQFSNTFVKLDLNTKQDRECYIESLGKLEQKCIKDSTQQQECSDSLKYHQEKQSLISFADTCSEVERKTIGDLLTRQGQENLDSSGLYLKPVKECYDTPVSPTEQNIKNLLPKQDLLTHSSQERQILSDVRSRQEIGQGISNMRSTHEKGSTPFIPFKGDQEETTSSYFKEHIYEGNSFSGQQQSNPGDKNIIVYSSKAEQKPTTSSPINNEEIGNIIFTPTPSHLKEQVEFSKPQIRIEPITSTVKTYSTVVEPTSKIEQDHIMEDPFSTGFGSKRQIEFSKPQIKIEPITSTVKTYSTVVEPTSQIEQDHIMEDPCNSGSGSKRQIEVTNHQTKTESDIFNIENYRIPIQPLSEMRQGYAIDSSEKNQNKTNDAVERYPDEISLDVNIGSINTTYTEKEDVSSSILNSSKVLLDSGQKLSQIKTSLANIGNSLHSKEEKKKVFEKKVNTLVQEMNLTENRILCFKERLEGMIEKIQSQLDNSVEFAQKEKKHINVLKDWRSSGLEQKVVKLSQHISRLQIQTAELKERPRYFLPTIPLGSLEFPAKIKEVMERDKLQGMKDKVSKSLMSGK